MTDATLRLFRGMFGPERPLGSVIALGSVSVVDLGHDGSNPKDLDSFPIESAGIEHFAGNLVFVSGPYSNSSTVLRDISRGRDLFRSAGDCIVSSSFSRGGRYVALATRASTPAAPCDEALRLFDVTNAQEVGRSTACGAPTAPYFDPTGQRLVVSSRAQTCVEAVPSLRVLTRTVPFPLKADPDRSAREEVERAFLCGDAVCVDTTYGRALMADAVTGRITWLSENREMGWVLPDRIDDLLPPKVATRPARLLYGRDGERVFTLDANRRVVDFGPTHVERPAPAEPAALREALERVAAHTCRWRGALLPIEACR